ncbi:MULTISPECIES: HEAT repeat domain-containing protein [Desertifilum]|nr:MULTISPECIES: HEAT repeat domain-containing protein [Desertifilum]
MTLLCEPMSQTERQLIQAVEQADTPQRLVQAVQALSQAQTQAAIPTLIAVLGYNNPGAALAAVDGLVQLGEVAVTPILQQLDGYNYGARAYATRALAAIADPRALEVLLQAAQFDFAPSVRRAACKGLGMLNWQQLAPEALLAAQTEAYQALLTIAQDPDWAIRYAAIVGLQALALKSGSEIRTPIAQQLETLLNTEQDLSVRSRIQLASQQLHPPTVRA